MSSVILGIDPGLATTGFGVVQSETRDLQHVLQYGVIRTDAQSDQSIRLQNIYDEMSDIIRASKPDLAAVEQLFFGKNTKTAMVVGQARGVILLALAHNQVPIKEFTPLQIKIALTGYGRADKQQVQVLVKQLLHLPTLPKPDDAADALAIALTAAVHVPVLS
jgi:crossover junction endodeoxyribonuclease RuvC